MFVLCTSSAFTCQMRNNETVNMLLDQQMQNRFHKHDTHLLKSNDDVLVLDVKQI